MGVQDLYHHDSFADKLVTGLVANTVSTAGDSLYVTIPSYPDPTLRWGPVPWSPHQDSMPTVGTVCLLAFDENQQPWLIQWIGSWTDVGPG